MKVYLAGPVNTCGVDVARGWRSELTVDLEAMGFQVINPMRPGGHIDEGDFPPGQIVSRDLEDIAETDILLVNVMDIKASGNIPCGTFMEVFQAHRHLNKVVITVANDFYSIWLAEHSTKLVKSIPEALGILREIAAESRV